MSSLRHQNHRRRSHSASPSSQSARAPDKSWRVATKRAYPHLSSSTKDAFPPQKWDVDIWRRDKRRRQDIPIPPFVRIDRRDATTPSNSFFATNASDFHLSSRRERDPKIRRRPNHYFETRSMDLEDDDAHVDSRSLSRIRSSAFWELHRSVAENGEGLVRRMRDYEHSRSRTDVYTKAKEAQKRGRKHSSVAAFSRRLKPLHIDFDIDPEDEDDDDVQIFAGEMPRISLPGSACPSKRSLSLDFEGMEPSDHAYTTSQRCSSPIATSDSSLSIYHSDDEQSRHSSGTTSPNNSLYPLSPLFNLSLPEDNYSNHEALSLPVLSTSPSIPTSSPPCNITSASRTEKAIAALSLAMASGAGGIADYDALLDMQTWPSLDGCQVGEMWH